MVPQWMVEHYVALPWPGCVTILEPVVEVSVDHSTGHDLPELASNKARVQKRTIREEVAMFIFYWLHFCYHPRWLE